MFDIVTGGNLDLIGAEETDPVQALRNYCDVHIDCVPGGTECKLTAKLGIVGEDGTVRAFSETVDLAPLVAFCMEKLAAWHKRQHGENVAGFGDWFARVSRAARSIGENAAVRRIAQNAAIVAMPEFASAMRAYEVMRGAKAGDPDDRARVALVAEMADQGDPKAEAVISQMRVMNEMEKIKEEKEGDAQAQVSGLYAIGTGKGAYKSKGKGAKGKGRGGRRGSRGGSRSRGGYGNGPYDPTQDLLESQEMIEEAESMQTAALLKQQAEAARQQAEADYITALSMDEGRLSERDARDAASQIQESMAMEELVANAAQSAQGVYNPSSQLDAAVSGWLYNHPYRDNLQALASGFPGVGVAARTLYRAGLGK